MLMRETVEGLVQKLKKKAYDQGYFKGQRGQPISDADWEPEFVADYRRGYRDGEAKVKS